ncbi:hypothetical protein AB4851_22560 [Burkholderia sp. 22PA0099]|uniref:hypothetical protein n=1 Tax=Burkholderia sp. 22PA0099 TaxID=3237372 RepID=UPI0039C29CD6
MLLPPFDPPQIDDLTQYWRACTNADVHILILEVMHQRLTMRELADLTREAGRVIERLEIEPQPTVAPLRRMLRRITAEQHRAGPLDDPRSALTPYSEAWQARESVHCFLKSQPAEADPGETRARALPEFIALTWHELRARWLDIGRTKPPELTIEQRLMLEAVQTRRALRKFARLARAAEAAAPDSADAKLLRLAIEAEVDRVA